MQSLLIVSVMAFLLLVKHYVPRFTLLLIICIIFIARYTTNSTSNSPSLLPNIRGFILISEVKQPCCWFLRYFCQIHSIYKCCFTPGFLHSFNVYKKVPKFRKRYSNIPDIKIPINQFTSYKKPLQSAKGKRMQNLTANKLLYMQPDLS